MEINKLMEEYFDCHDKIKELQSIKERIQAEIKLYMSNDNLEFYNNKGHKITYRSQIRKSLDKEKILTFISEDNLNKCYKETEFKVLKVLSKESLEKMKGFMK